MSNKHSEFSPSSFERRVKCPASWTMEKGLESEDTAMSAMGTDYHKRVADAINGKADADWMVGRCVEVAANTADELGILDGGKSYIEREFRFDYFGTPINFGTVDFVCVNGDKALVIDWKFGYEEVTDAEDNWQLRWYSFFVLNEFKDVQEVTALIFNPRIGQYTRCTYGREYVMKTILPSLLNAIETCKKETEHYSCGEHCKYCKGRTACPALKECADRYMLMTDKQDLTLWTDDKLIAYYEKVGIVKKVIDSITEEVKRRTVENGHCGKYVSKEQSAGYDVKDVKELCNKLMERGITMDQFLGFCRISMTPVFDALYQLDKLEDKKETKKTSKEKAVSFLGETIYEKDKIVKVVENK